MGQLINSATSNTSVKPRQRADRLEQAELINVNAYNQPGVEAGKQAADAVIELQDKILVQLARAKDEAMTAVEVANAIEAPERTEDVYHILRHLSANDDHGVTCTQAPKPSEIRFQSSSQ